MLLKVWKAHEQATHKKVASAFAEVKNLLRKFEPHVANLTGKYIKAMQTESRKEEDFIRMRDRYSKALYLIEIASQKLYQAQDAATQK